VRVRERVGSWFVVGGATSRNHHSLDTASHHLDRVSVLLPFGHFRDGLSSYIYCTCTLCASFCFDPRAFFLFPFSSFFALTHTFYSLFHFHTSLFSLHTLTPALHTSPAHSFLSSYSFLVLNQPHPSFFTLLHLPLLLSSPLPLLHSLLPTHTHTPCPPTSCLTTLSSSICSTPQNLPMASSPSTSTAQPALMTPPPTSGQPQQPWPPHKTIKPCPWI